jgi:hypothetical protein
MIHFLYFLLFTLAQGGPVAAQEDAPVVVQEYGDRLDRVYDATVRVSVSGGTGTGTIYKEDEQYYYILTNAHVATSNRVGLEFTKNHYPSPRYQGEVVFRVLRSGVDVAVARVAKNSLPAGIDLPVIPLATAEEVSKELLLVTSGCQAGERPSVQNTITTRDTANLIYYLPTSRPGRSGSSLVSRDGKTIQGLVAWMTDRGPNSEGLAMKVDVIRPLLEGENTTVSYDDFPLGAIQIPLGSAEYVETELHALSECLPDSCLDDNCPWDYDYITQLSAVNDPWRRRFGGPTQPQPQAPSAPQPQTPVIPDNPWQMRPDVKPQPQPEPQQPPKPQPDRPRLFDSEREFGRLFERFDRLEPKIDRLGEDLKKRQEEELEESRRRQRLLDRVERLPDRLIGPDDLNKFAERQSETLVQRLGNAMRSLFWTIVGPFVWAWWILVFVGVMFVLNQFMPGLLGSNWITVLFVAIANIVIQLIRALIAGFNTVRSAIPTMITPTAPQTTKTVKTAPKKTTASKPKTTRAKSVSQKAGK